MTDQLHNAIEENAAGPKKVKGDSAEVEQHALKDQIDAARFLASQASGSIKRVGRKNQQDGISWSITTWRVSSTNCLGARNQRAT